MERWNHPDKMTGIERSIIIWWVGVCRWWKDLFVEPLTTDERTWAVRYAPKTLKCLRQGVISEGEAAEIIRCFRINQRVRNSAEW